MQRRIRVLVGKPGLDGHDRGAKVVAAALRDAGMEVIYTGLHQAPEQIVEAALQEDVDVVALSILSGAHMTQFPEVMSLMRERGLQDRLLTGGGIIPPEDMETLARDGVGRLFGPGSSTQDIVEYIRGWYAERHGQDALPPLPPPREPARLAMGVASGAAVAAARTSAALDAHHARRAAAPASRGKAASARRAKKAVGARNVTQRASAGARPRRASAARSAARSAPKARAAAAKRGRATRGKKASRKG